MQTYPPPPLPRLAKIGLKQEIIGFTHTSHAKPPRGPEASLCALLAIPKILRNFSQPSVPY